MTTARTTAKPPDLCGFDQRPCPTPDVEEAVEEDLTDLCAGNRIWAVGQSVLLKHLSKHRDEEVTNET